MSKALNNRTAAVIDPILSTHARGYRNSTFISTVLFRRSPFQPLNARHQVRQGSLPHDEHPRAPAPTRSASSMAMPPIRFSLVQDALEGVVPVEHQEEAESVPGIDLAAGAVNMVLDVIDLGHEIEAAGIARNQANYDANHKLALVGADRWTDPNSDPRADFDAAKEIIRRSIGRYPNTLTLGPNAGNALKNHPKIKEQFKYTGRDSITTDMIAAYFDIRRVVIGAAVFLPETSDDAALANDVWGDDAILAYVPEAGDNFQVPSFAYTYELRGYPQVEQPYFERFERQLDLPDQDRAPCHPDGGRRRLPVPECGQRCNGGGHHGRPEDLRHLDRPRQDRWQARA